MNGKRSIKRNEAVDSRRRKTRLARAARKAKAWRRGR